MCSLSLKNFNLAKREVAICMQWISVQRATLSQIRLTFPKIIYLSLFEGALLRMQNLCFEDQKFKTNYSWKKITSFGSKTTSDLSLCLHKGRPSYRRSFQLSKESIQHFKTWNFLIFSTFVGHFCPPGSGSGFRIRIRIHWPDWIRIQYGSGS